MKKFSASYGGTKENFIVKFIHQIANRIGSKSKFEKKVVQKMKNDLTEIEKDIATSIEMIEEQTINLIAAIEEVRANINAEFNSAME